MENSPGILFWILALVCVVSAVIAVSAKRALIIAIALVVTILATLNLLISLGIIGLSFIYALTLLIVIAAFFLAIRTSAAARLKSLEILSYPKPLFYFVISILFYIGCLILISYTQVWQYAIEYKSVTFIDTLTALGDKYLIPFALFKSFLVLLLIILFLNQKRRTA